MAILRSTSRSQSGNQTPESKKTVSVGLDTLDAAQVEAIDRAIQEVGEYGEIHLIVRRGQVRFIGKLKTEELTSEP